MKINKQLFEDILSGKLKGAFVLRNGTKLDSSLLKRNKHFVERPFERPYGFERNNACTYYENGLSYIMGAREFDIIDFIPETDTIQIDFEIYSYNEKDVSFIERFINGSHMKENELTIEIPDGKIVDWKESKKQNKIVLKDKQLTYEDICKKLLSEKSYFITNECTIHPTFEKNQIFASNCAFTQHQLVCILAKNKLANVANYLNDGWKPGEFIFGYFICVCNKELEINERTSYKYNNNVIFKTKELAEQAVEILGEETVKLALEPLGI